MNGTSLTSTWRAGNRALQVFAFVLFVSLTAMAGRAGARKLVLAHFMARSLRDLDGNSGRVREHYDGPVIAANDHDCFGLP